MNHQDWNELSDFMIKSYDTFPSLKQMMEFLDQRGLGQRNKQRVVNQRHCDDCDDTGHLFAEYKGKAGAICCMCDIGQDIKSYKKDMADLRYVIERGGRSLTYKEYLNRKPTPKRNEYFT